MQTKEEMIIEGIALDASLVSMESTYDNTTSSEHQDESNNLGYDVDAKKVLVDTVASDNENVYIGPSYDTDMETFHMLLLKDDNVMGKQGLGIENKNYIANPNILNKAKELTPSLYSIDEIGKEFLSDHKTIAEEELKHEAENPRPLV
ncbi:hypothetical protein Tco_1057677 [Tanacetum coccineum]|uniref:Uncharacterized protein n=1 Tax=Tanacetum coccineum TaxID=301880 RepID=A0ABQ5H6T2_9ASTR